MTVDFVKYFIYFFSFTSFYLAGLKMVVRASKVVSAST